MSRNLGTHENALIVASRLIYIAAQVYLGVLEPAVQMHFFGGSVDKPGFLLLPVTLLGSFQRRRRWNLLFKPSFLIPVLIDRRLFSAPVSPVRSHCGDVSHMRITSIAMEGRALPISYFSNLHF